MARPRAKIEERQNVAKPSAGNKSMSVSLISFGYKAGPPPLANMLFDVRFLKNPFWVPELRDLTGIDSLVRDYVLAQSAAGDFLDSLINLLSLVIPRFAELEIFEFSLALGCTGGQHRSTALVEELADRLQIVFPHYEFKRYHRELAEVQS